MYGNLRRTFFTTVSTIFTTNRCFSVFNRLHTKQMENKSRKSAILDQKLFFLPKNHSSVKLCNVSIFLEIPHHIDYLKPKFSKIAIKMGNLKISLKVAEHI